MPLFSNKFSPKKAHSRKSVISLNTDADLQDLIQENGTVNIKLSDQELIFKNGAWVPASGAASNIVKLNQKLRQQLIDIEEENNLLKLKLEILLNMLTQATAENHLQQREIDKLQKMETRIQTS